MPKSLFCSVRHCKNKRRVKESKTSKISFHIFPKDPILRQMWAKFCQEPRKWEPKKHNVVCSVHFKPEDYVRMGRIKRLKLGAVPSRSNKWPSDKECAVPTCEITKFKNPDKRFYRFPKDAQVLKSWCDNIFGNKVKVNVNGSAVCSDHFGNNCFEQDPSLKVLKDSAIPSINVPYLTHEYSEVKEEQDASDIKYVVEKRIDSILMQNQEILQKNQPISKSKNVSRNVKYKSEEKDEKTQNITEMAINIPLEENKNDSLLISLDVICRFCYSEENLSKIIEVAWGAVPLIDILSKYADIHINSSDTNMPSHICHSCLKKMFDAYSFFTKCQSSENYLKNLIENAETKKEEVKDETEQEGELDITNLNDTAFDSDSSSVISEKNETTKSHEQSVISKGSRRQQKSNLITQTMGLPWNVYKPKILVKGPPYVCPVCNANYKKREDLSLHRKEAKHTCSRRYVCPFDCGKKYETLSKLREHYQSHTGEKWEKCDTCNFTTNSLNSLRRHRKRHTGERNHTCEPCGRGFIRLECYQNHLRKYHNKEKLKCDTCSKDFDNKTKFNEHMRGHQESDDDIPLSKRKKYKPVEGGPYQCEICGKTLKTKLAFTMHVDNHGPKKVPCEQCEKMFTSKMQLYYHKYYAHTTKQHICEVCGLTFKLLKQYKDHIFIHQEDIVCNICNKNFLSKRSLFEHMHLHNADAPYKCKICQKPLRSTGHLNIHLRTHTGEKPFACDVCGKVFSQKSNMLQHKNTHVTDRRYQCNRCGASFKDERNCRRHRARNTCLPKLDEMCLPKLEEKLTLNQYE